MQSETINEPKPPLRNLTGGKWQFGIRHLLGLMTYVGVVLGIATWQGPQTLMVTLGLGLALLSHLGAFERLQRGKVQLILVGVAWVAYLVSLCTPCGVGTFTFYGWEAAWGYFWGPIFAIFTQEAKLQGSTWPWLWSINVANVLQLALPLLIWRLGQRCGKVLSMLICLAMVGPWTTLIMMPGLYVAYYIWCISYMLLVIAVPVSRETLIGMFGLAMLHVAIFKIFDGSG